MSDILDLYPDLPVLLLLRGKPVISTTTDSRPISFLQIGCRQVFFFIMACSCWWEVDKSWLGTFLARKVIKEGFSFARIVNG